MSNRGLDIAYKLHFLSFCFKSIFPYPAITAVEIYRSSKVSVYSYTFGVTAGLYVSFRLSERPNQHVRI
jgi:hypothetical protein